MTQKREGLDTNQSSLNVCDGCDGAGDGPAYKKGQDGKMMIGCRFAASSEGRKKFVPIPDVASNQDCKYYRK